MKLSSLLPLTLLALVPLSRAEECVGCSLLIGPITTWEYQSPDPECHTTIQFAMWPQGGTDGNGECASGINIETGASECKPATGCFLSWAYSVDSSIHSESCTGVEDPNMSYEYTYNDQSSGSSFNKFGYNFVVEGSTRMHCGANAVMQIDSNGTIAEGSVSCSPCEN
ncbi:MAG: hypothetical protein WD226_08450 [Planctomycetota bacterium]